MYQDESWKPAAALHFKTD